MEKGNTYKKKICASIQGRFFGSINENFFSLVDNRDCTQSPFMSVATPRSSRTNRRKSFMDAVTKMERLTTKKIDKAINQKKMKQGMYNSWFGNKKNKFVHSVDT